MKTTERSIWAAAAAIMLCLTLLIGATFAWFTDSVTSSGNKIQAGNLDVDLVQLGATLNEGQKDEIDANIDDDEYYSLAGVEAPIFDQTLWEPGYTEYVVIGVKNNGNLALKYTLDIVPKGDVGELADAIEVYSYSSDTALTTDSLAAKFEGFDSFEDVINNLTDYTATPPTLEFIDCGTLSDRIDEGLFTGVMNKSDGSYWVLVLHMDEDAGNEYQGASLGDSFDIVLKATQNTFEEDGFGNKDYDADAAYPEFYSVDAGSDLAGLVNEPGVPVEITSTENVLNQKAFDVTGNVTMNLGLNTINPSDSQITGTNITVKEGGSLTINAEANSYGFTYTAGKLASDGEDSTMVINGGRYGNSGSGSSEVSALNGGTVYINEGIFSTSGASGHAVNAGTDSTIYINGGSFSSSGAKSVVIFADGGTIIVEDIDSITANGGRFGVENGGQILISKTYSPSKPTSVASGCTVTDNGDGYWLVTKA